MASVLPRPVPGSREGRKSRDTACLTYRCFLPDLTKFVSVCCAGSGHKVYSRWKPVHGWVSRPILLQYPQVRRNLQGKIPEPGPIWVDLGDLFDNRVIQRGGRGAHLQNLRE